MLHSYQSAMFLPLSTCFVSLFAYCFFIRLYPSSNDGDDDEFINKERRSDVTVASIRTSTNSTTYTNVTTYNDYQRSSYPYKSINTNDHNSDYNNKNINIDDIDNNNNNNNNNSKNNDMNKIGFTTYQTNSHYQTVDPHIIATSSPQSTIFDSIDPEDIPIEYDTTLLRCAALYRLHYSHHHHQYHNHHH